MSCIATKKDDSKKAWDFSKCSNEVVMVEGGGDGSRWIVRGRREGEGYTVQSPYL
jgi:hypothetical protein